MTRPLLSTTALAVLMPAVALAEVTPDDVWANLQAATRAFGGTMTADTSRDGNVLTAANMSMVFNLPLGVGRITADVGTMTLADNGDGTVALGGPMTQEMVVALEITGEGGGTVTMATSLADYVTTASGDPGNVTYDYTIGRYGFEFTDLTLTGGLAVEAEDFTVEGTFDMRDLSGSYTITEGELLTLASTGTVGSGDFDMSYSTASDSGSISVSQTATMGAMQAEGSVALPANGTSVMQFAQAFRAGLAISYVFSSEGQSSEQETLLDGELFSSQSDAIGASDGQVRLDADGFAVEMRADSYDFEMLQPLMMPVPLRLAMDRLEGAFALPFLQSDDPQDVVLRLGIDGLTVDPELWAMIDPGAQLPRDPASVLLDVTGQVKVLFDLVDPIALGELDQSGAMPGELLSLDLNSLSARAVGAGADASGAFTFDNTDLVSFDGIPAPDGRADIVLTGVNGLLDRLLSMGLLSQDDMMGARMVLGGFFRPGDAADELVTEIEIDGAAGTISAGGQRIK